MKFTDIFIKRPVLATVLSLLILVLGLRSATMLPIQQYPQIQNAVITVTTYYTGADPDVVAGFITTPLENAIAQAQGIDYLTSNSTLGTSTITATLRLNYDPNIAVTDINTKINSVLNRLPQGTQPPVISVAVGDTFDSMYIGFYSPILPANKITDYLTRVVQPKLQAVKGVQLAEILGGKQFALRAWLDPAKLAAFHLTAADVSNALAQNNFISAVGRTGGNMMTVNLTADTNLESLEEFRNMVVKTQNDTIIRLGDIANVSLGAENYDYEVTFDGRAAVYMGIKVAPGANVLDVVQGVRDVFPSIDSQLPEGLSAKIVYDATEYVNDSIHEVEHSLVEALIIVTIVIFLFLGSIRSVLIPVIAIPLSLIGAFFIMLAFHFTINLLTLLALVLAIGLVVDDAIIVVENVHRHIEAGMAPFDAALQGARELAGPIIAISVVLIAVYVPIGFMGGLTGALFTEFAFTLAGAVAVSAIVALTLSPMMCARFLKPMHNGEVNRFAQIIDTTFERIREKYEGLLNASLNNLRVTAVFAAIILASIYVFYSLSKSELAPQEDQGLLISQLIAAPNASLDQTKIYANEAYKIFSGYPETDHVFQFIGMGGLNEGFTGMVLKPWSDRKHTTNDLQPQVQQQLKNIAGAQAFVFQPPSLPGGGGGPSIQFVIQTTKPFLELYNVSQDIKEKAMASGKFMFMMSDLKIDKAQTTIVIDRDKAAQLGINMQNVGNVLSSMLSQGYINYFNYDGRAYQVIPQAQGDNRFNADEIMNYYINTSNGTQIPLSTIATLKTKVVPESVNHFQQLNSATLSGEPMPGVSMGEALASLDSIAKKELSQGYTVDYAGQSRQMVQEGNSLVITFFFALIIIFLALSAQFESFRDPLIVLISVPMSICGAMIFICLGFGGVSLNIYTEVGLVTLIGLISKHGILIVQFANELQEQGKSKREAIEAAAGIRLRPILMTTAAMVLGVMPLILASGAGAMSRYNIGLVIATGIAIGTLFTLFVVPAMYMYLAQDHHDKNDGQANLEAGGI